MPSVRRPRPRRTWMQRIMLAVNVIVIVGAVGSAGLLAYAKDTVSKVPRVQLANTLAQESGESEEALNFLIVGIDGIAGLPEDSPLRNTRQEGVELTDTMMVLRIDPANGQASVLSIPRDLWVTLSGAGYSAKINAARGSGGPERLIDTISDTLDIPIHRYVEVQFNGFLELIRILDGVSVQIDHPLRDPKAQLRINRTGCVTLTPLQALGYVRSRTLEAEVEPGLWQLVDQTSDLGRIQRQQEFLVIALQKAFDKGLRNPNTLRRILDDIWGAGYFTLDTRTTPADLIDLGRQFENFRADSLGRYSLPTVAGFEGPQAVLYLVESDAQRILNVFRGVDADSISFSLSVRNGTGESGLGSGVQAAMNAAGFNVVDTGNADTFDYDRTTIRFDATQARQAQTLARWLTVDPVLDEVDGDGTSTMQLVVGRDWDGLREEPLPRPTPSAAATPSPTPTPTGPTPTPSPTPEPLAQIRAC